MIIIFFQVILRNGKTELELYLITLKLYRHQSNSARQVANPWTAPVGSVASSYGTLKLFAVVVFFVLIIQMSSRLSLKFFIKVSCVVHVSCIKNKNSLPKKCLTLTGKHQEIIRKL